MMIYLYIFLSVIPHLGKKILSEQSAWSVSRRCGCESRYVQFFIRFLNKYDDIFRLATMCAKYYEFFVTYIRMIRMLLYFFCPVISRKLGVKSRLSFFNKCGIYRRKSAINTLRSPVWRHCLLGGGTQHRA